MIISLIAVTSLFAYLSPHYNRLIVRASNSLVGLLEHPRRTVLQAQGRRALVLERSLEEETPLLRYNYEQYFGIILFLALLLPTPRLGLARRIVYALVGVCIFVVLHTLVLTINAGMDTHGGDYTWQRSFFQFTRVPIAVLLWALLTFRYWLPWPKAVSLKGKQLRPNDPCPCGSGKKYKYCCGK